MKSLISAISMVISCLFMNPVYANIGSDEIGANVQKFLHSDHLPTLQTLYPEGEFKIEVGKIDPRLSLTPCSENMQYKLHGARKNYGYLTVKVSCQGNQPWTIYVSANVDVKTSVVVTNRPVKRGEIIDIHMVELQQRNLNGLGQHFFNAVEDVVGKQALHTTSSQRVVRGNMLKEALAVKRGDKVTIIAKSDALAVKMNGTALSNGHKGDQIRVQNNRSKRVIRAEVLGSGQVAVLF